MNRLLIVAFATIAISMAGTILAKDSNQPPDGPLSLPSPVQRVAFNKNILAQHPRIFLNAVEVDGFREKLRNPVLKEMWEKYLGWVDYELTQSPPANPGSEDMVRIIGDRLLRVSFAYLVSHEAKYLAGARKIINAVVGYPTWANDVDLGAAHIEFGLALAYDWLYADLTPKERQVVAEALQKHGRILLYRSARYPGSWWGSAYFQNHCWINHTGASTAAMALYESDPKEMQRWLDYTRTQFETTYRHMGLDSGYHEGPAYMDYGTTWILYYIESLKSVSGEDLGDMPFLKNLARHYVDVYMPDARNMANFGDSYAMGFAPVGSAILPWLAAHQKNGLAEWMRQNNRAAFLHQPPFESPFGLLWFDPSIKPKSPQDLPTCGLYPDLGLVVFRSSWDQNAAVVTLRCGPPGGHHVVKEWPDFKNPASTFGHSHPDANSFLFWSDSQWRIGAPGAYTHDKKTHNENVWTVGGKGQRGSDEMWFEPATYFEPGRKQPYLERVVSTVAADYVIGEAALAYDDSAKLTEFKRHLLFVKGPKPYVVVFDRLKSNVPQSWNSYLHTYGKIVLNDLPKPGEENMTSSSLASIPSPHKNPDKWEIHGFQASGALPPVEDCGKMVNDPILTPTYGVVVSPKSLLKAGPLTVVDHERDKSLDTGYELNSKCSELSTSTWLITVVGGDQHVVTLLKVDPSPSLKVDGDKIAWGAEGDVSLNDHLLEGDLLPKQ